MIVAKNITNSVPTAVCISTLIMHKGHTEICYVVMRRDIDNARISQWCKEDHPNNTYNYLHMKRKETNSLNQYKNKGGL